MLIRLSWATLNTELHLIYSIPFTTILWIPYLIFLLLTIEKTALKYLKYSFEAWFKVITAICHFIAIYLDYFILNGNEWIYLELAFIERILYGLSYVLLIINVSCFDGFNISWKWKLMITSVIAMICLVWSTWTAILEKQDSSPKWHYINLQILEITPWFAISLTSYQVSTMRTLSIFLIKQSIYIFIRRNKQKNQNLRRTPFIIWIKKQSTNNVQNTNDLYGQTDSVWMRFDHQTINEHCINTKIYFYFDESDSFLTHLFGNDIAIKCKYYLHTKIVHCIVCVSLLLYTFLNIYFITEISQIISIIILLFILIPYSICFILLCSRKGFKCILGMFDFWLKTIYATIYIICTLIDKLILNKNIWSNYTLQFIKNIYYFQFHLYYLLLL